MLAEDAELALVMSEIAEAMSGRSVVLTVHPQGGTDPSILYSGHPDIDRDRAKILTEAASVAAEAQAGRVKWRGGINGAGATLLIPVEIFPGHSPLVISILFDDATPEKRSFAEKVYSTRRPFAVGYFRLWQANRTLKRRGEALEAALNLTEIGFC